MITHLCTDSRFRGLAIKGMLLSWSVIPDQTSQINPSTNQHIEKWRTLPSPSSPPSWHFPMPAFGRPDHVHPSQRLSRHSSQKGWGNIRWHWNFWSTWKLIPFFLVSGRLVLCVWDTYALHNTREHLQPLPIWAPPTRSQQHQPVHDHYQSR